MGNRRVLALDVVYFRLEGQVIDAYFDKSIQEAVREAFPLVAGCVLKYDHGLEVSVLDDGFVQLHYEDGASVVEKTVDPLDNLLLSQVQVHECRPTSTPDAFQEGLVFPEEGVVDGLELA